MKDIKIEIILRDRETGDLLAKRTSLGFEGAQEDLGKMERYFAKMVRDIDSLQDLWQEEDPIDETEKNNQQEN